MNLLSIILIGIAVAAMLGAVGVLLINRRQDKQRGLAEDAVAKAAQDYFARFQIRARTIGAQLSDDSVVLMVETPPHKKLRFSYIIEPPIKNFIRVQTGIEVTRIFWRFPIPLKKTQAPEVNYADADTVQLNTEDAKPSAVQKITPAQAAEIETDDYFHQHQTYHIEEVSWEDFSTVTQAPAVETKDKAPAETEKK